LDRIEATVTGEPGISRRSLARQVCEWLDWRSVDGRFKEMSCRKALAELARRGRIALPECGREFAFQRRRDRASEEVAGVAEFCGELRALGEIEIVLVSSRYSKLSAVWNGLLGQYHYLGNGPLCGAQLRYLVRSKRYGWLGGLSFSAAASRLKARDEWIGWGDAAWQAHLPEVVCNSRFLLVPTVEVANLGSHILSRVLRRLPGDWEKRYGYRPRLVETFVDPSRFAGTTYRAANWEYLGRTAARRTPHANGKVSEGAKDVYGYPLQEDWRERLCAVPQRRLGTCPPPEAPTDWVEEEFGRVELYDNRLRERLHLVARDFYAQPGELIPQACHGDEAKVKGAYRFMENERVEMSVLLRSHAEATVDRIRGHRVVLAVQDTTTLNYTAHAPRDVGPINTTKDGAVGLLMHDTLAFTVDGTPLGLLDVQCWARDPQTAGKREQRKELPIESKESIKWLRSYQTVAEVQETCPKTRLVSVGDREADLYELFAEAHAHPGGPDLLVRAEKSRNRKVRTLPQNGTPEYLWAYMGRQSIAGSRKVVIPRRGTRPKRTAKLAVRFAPMTLKPPRDKKDLPAVRVWAVYAVEEEAPPQVNAPLEWMLLTTVPTTNFRQAGERLTWYTRRWGIEIFHRVLKSGCRIQDRRLDTADRIETCLAIDLVIAWRIYHLTKQGRETPHMPCDVLLEEDEWKVLAIRFGKSLDTPPSLRDALRMIAALGGFLGRKGDGEPGTITLWRGLRRLAAMVEGFRLALTISAHPRAAP